jgi:uncharacterized membrane protein YccC
MTISTDGGYGDITRRRIAYVMIGTLCLIVIMTVVSLFTPFPVNDKLIAFLSFLMGFFTKDVGAILVSVFTGTPAVITDDGDPANSTATANVTVQTQPEKK